MAQHEKNRRRRAIIVVPVHDVLTDTDAVTSWHRGDQFTLVTSEGPGRKITLEWALKEGVSEVTIQYDRRIRSVALLRPAKTEEGVLHLWQRAGTQGKRPKKSRCRGCGKQTPKGDKDEAGRFFCTACITKSVIGPK